MYTYTEFPNSRIKEIREECGCNYAQVQRLELLQLFDDARDEEDIQSVFKMLEEADAFMETCRSKARAQLQKELKAHNEAEDKKLLAWQEERRAQFEQMMLEAKQKFCASMGFEM